MMNLRPLIPKDYIPPSGEEIYYAYCHNKNKERLVEEIFLKMVENYLKDKCLQKTFWLVASEQYDRKRAKHKDKYLYKELQAVGFLPTYNTMKKMASPKAHSIFMKYTSLHIIQLMEVVGTSILGMVEERYYKTLESITKIVNNGEEGYLEAGNKDGLLFFKELKSICKDIFIVNAYRYVYRSKKKVEVSPKKVIEITI